MKRVIFLIFLVLGISTTIAQYKISHLDTINLKSLGITGNVSSISDFSFKVSEQNGVIVKGEQLDNYPSEDKYKWSSNLYFDENIRERIDYKYYFNTKGENTKRSKFNHSTTAPYVTTSYVYGDSGRVEEVREQMTSLDYNGEVNQVNIFSKYTYQSGSQIKQIDTYRNQKIWSRTMFEYLDDNLISKKKFDYDGDLIESHKYEYRNNFLEVINTTEFDFEEGNSYVKVEEIIKLNDKGKIIYEYRKDNERDGYYKSESIYEYNSSGNKIKETYIRSYKSLSTNYDNVKSVFSYIYSNNNLSAIESSDEQGNVYHISKFEYLADGVVVKTSVDVKNNKNVIKHYSAKKLLIKTEDEEGNTYTYTYKFDNRGNWVSVIEYKNTIPIKMRIRDIKYNPNKNN
ncbi:hypothetical protein ACILPE_06045 [Capnocytophaga canimorsus]|uniref:hypothetical protein n=1 Tax=Capnocytophaga canimorsus TaxID=28188 RepID=UPI0037D4B498